MKIITATLASLSVAIGLVAPTQVQAQDNDLAKIIAGIATVAIIAKIADDRRDRKRAEAQARQQTNSHTNRNRWNDTNQPVFGSIIGGRPGVQPRQDYKATQLPVQCERLVQTSRGVQPVYGARCLNQNYRYASRLPDRCRVLIDTHRGNRPAYAARCLRRDGWNVARR